MERAISAGLFIMAAVAASMALINAVIPAVGKGSSALLVANTAASERMRTDIEIVFATGDTVSNEIILWVKSVGSETIPAIDESDVFLTTPSAVSRIPHWDGSGAAPPDYWDYVIENGTAWSQAVTVKVTLHMDTTGVAAGIHTARFSVHNGVSAEKEFSV